MNCQESSPPIALARNSCSPTPDAPPGNRCQYIRYIPVLVPSPRFLRFAGAAWERKSDVCTRDTRHIRFAGPSRSRNSVFSHAIPAAVARTAPKAGEIEILLRKPRKSRLMTDRESKPPSRSPPTDNDGKQWRRGAQVRTYLCVPVPRLGGRIQCLRRAHGVPPPCSHRPPDLSVFLPPFGLRPRREVDARERRRRKKEPARTHRAAYNYYNYRRPPAICSLIVTLHSADSPSARISLPFDVRLRRAYEYLRSPCRRSVRERTRAEERKRERHVAS